MNAPAKHPARADLCQELRCAIEDLAEMCGIYLGVVCSGTQAHDDGLVAYGGKAFAAHARALVQTINDLSAKNSEQERSQ